MNTQEATEAYIDKVVIPNICEAVSYIMAIGRPVNGCVHLKFVGLTKEEKYAEVRKISKLLWGDLDEEEN